MNIHVINNDFGAKSHDRKRHMIAVNNKPNVTGNQSPINPGTKSDAKIVFTPSMTKVNLLVGTFLRHTGHMCMWQRSSSV